MSDRPKRGPAKGQPPGRKKEKRAEETGTLFPSPLLEMTTDRPTAGEGGKEAGSETKSEEGGKAAAALLKYSQVLPRLLGCFMLLQYSGGRRRRPQTLGGRKEEKEEELWKMSSGRSWRQKGRDSTARKEATGGK